jgi:hypothetical protein
VHICAAGGVAYVARMIAQEKGCSRVRPVGTMTTILRLLKRIGQETIVPRSLDAPTWASLNWVSVRP